MSAPQVDHAHAVLIHAHGRTAGVLPEDAPERASDGDEIRVDEAVDVGTAHTWHRPWSEQEANPLLVLATPAVPVRPDPGFGTTARSASQPQECGPGGRSRRRGTAHAPSTQGVMATSGRLSAMDAAFLYLERPVQRLHVGSVSLLDGPVPYGAFVELTVQRLGKLPRYAQRPVRPVLDWALPSWQDVPRFDPRHHIRHVGVPPPGGDAELHTLIDELMAAPLDPDSPLWETYLIDGLADGRAAILNKVHHCMIDGVSGAQLLEVLTDPASELATEPAAPPPMLRAHGSGGARPWSAHAAVEAASTLARWALEPPSQLPFNAPISAERRLRWTVAATRAAARRAWRRRLQGERRRPLGRSPAGCADGSWHTPSRPIDSACAPWCR